MMESSGTRCTIEVRWTHWRRIAACAAPRTFGNPRATNRICCDKPARCKFQAGAVAYDRGSVGEFTVDKPAILMLSLLFSIGINAAAPSNAAEPSAPPLDSVTVKAHRENLRILSARMVK